MPVSLLCCPLSADFFFYNAPATYNNSTLSLHDALPIFPPTRRGVLGVQVRGRDAPRSAGARDRIAGPDPHLRSEEHTSELQSLRHLVCRLLLEKKKVLAVIIRNVKSKV